MGRSEKIRIRGNNPPARHSEEPEATKNPRISFASNNTGMLRFAQHDIAPRYPLRSSHMNPVDDGTL
jgi:hypothetical protein